MYFSSVEEANIWIAANRFDTEAWDDLAESGEAKKSALLNQAYHRLYYSKEFNLPKPEEASTDDLEILKQAEAEMALYLAIHGLDEPRRKGLQAQGVTGAGYVEEQYDKDRLDETPIPQFVRDLLCGFRAGPTVLIGGVDIRRNDRRPTDRRFPRGY